MCFHCSLLKCFRNYNRVREVCSSHVKTPDALQSTISILSSPIKRALFMTVMGKQDTPCLIMPQPSNFYNTSLSLQTHM